MRSRRTELELLQDLPQKPRRSPQHGTVGRENAVVDELNGSSPAALLAHHELPPWYTQYRFIHTGYRNPALMGSLRDTLATAFDLHSETLNVHSHLWGAPATIALALVVALDPDWGFQTASWSAWLSLGLVAGGSAIMMLASATAHLLHVRSDAWARALWIADYSSITLCLTGKLFCDLYLSLGLAHYTAFQVGMALSVAVLSAFLALTISGKAWGVNLVGAWCMGPALVLLGLQAHSARSCWVVCATMPADGSGDDLDLSMIRTAFWFSFASSLIGACGTVLYNANFPEVLAPGRFDLVGNSHNIWHVLVVIACLAQVMAAAHVPLFEATVVTPGLHDSCHWLGFPRIAL